MMNKGRQNVNFMTYYDASLSLHLIYISTEHAAWEIQHKRKKKSIKLKREGKHSEINFHMCHVRNVKKHHCGDAG